MSIAVEGNNIHFIGRITHEIGDVWPRVLEQIDFSSGAVINLHMSSPGGSVSAADAMLDALQTCGLPFITHIHKTENHSGVSSAASVICAHSQKIFMDGNATFMIHFGTSEPNDEDVMFWMNHCDKDYDIIKNLMVKEKKMRSSEALKLRFVHQVIKGAKYDMNFV